MQERSLLQRLSRKRQMRKGECEGFKKNQFFEKWPRMLLWEIDGEKVFKMNKFLFGFLLIAIFASEGNAQQSKRFGEKIANEAIVLIMFSEMANIGAGDPDFEGELFPTTDINRLIESEIVPLLKTMGRKFDEKLEKGAFSEIVNQLRQFPEVKKDGVKIANHVYLERKNMYIKQYGKENAGIALSVMIQTVIHQKKIALKVILELL